MDIKKDIDILIKKLPVFFIIVVMLLLYSCRDNDFIGAEESDKSKWEKGEQLIIPFTIYFDTDVASRADREPEDGFQFGTSLEHFIDFSSEKESFAIFFDEKRRVKYIKMLYLSSELGDGIAPAPEPSVNEYAVPVLCYVDRKDVISGMLEEEQKEKDWSPLGYVSIVLNGQPLYDKIESKINELVAVHSDDDIREILSMTWNNPAMYKADYANKNEDLVGPDVDNNGIIGFNSNGYFTMTNSAYYETVVKETENSEGEKELEFIPTLMTAKPLKGKFFVSIEEYQKEKLPTTTVYVERMVSKFSPPTFSTHVIGADRVFRPDQNSLQMNIFTWEGDLERYDSKNWRIHLKGWSLSGYESENYIFKNLPAYEKKIWWNDEERHRSYWSWDPHYNNYETDYYPWQIRKSADTNDIISLEFGLTQNGGRKTPVLRYKSFNQINSEGTSGDTWNSVGLYMHENTYNPNPTPPWNLDGHPETIAGPHLIVTAEIYIEDPEGTDYAGMGMNFRKINDLYGDRSHNYYLNEKDWFKMFVKKFNTSLATQEKMGFDYIDWSKGNDKSYEHYIVFTPGQCRIFYDGKMLTNELIDQLYESKAERKTEKNPGYLCSKFKAYLRNGDGRVVPWLDKGLLDDGDRSGLTIKKPKLDDQNQPMLDSSGRIIYEEVSLEYIKESDRKSSQKDEEVTPRYNNWNDENFYRSFFYEWFGPIDHYHLGYMYYTGEITHRSEYSGNNFFGIVRNHWYKFNIQSINSLGIPVDDPEQLIIPEKHAYRDEMSTQLEVIDWHPRETEIEFDPPQ